jgi:hypothetical protein
MSYEKILSYPLGSKLIALNASNSLVKRCKSCAVLVLKDYEQCLYDFQRDSMGKVIKS